MSDDAIPSWRQTSRKEVMRCRVFTVQQRAMEEEDPASNRAGDFFVIDAPDWVNVVALTDDDELVLIEQWRHGTQTRTWEIPGGMVDPGETPGVAGQRELLEETGFAPRQWYRLGTVTPNPAIQSNRCHTFLGLGCRRAAAPQLDGNERIRVQLRPYPEAARWVAEGRIDHALVIAALHWETLRRAGLLEAVPA